MILTFETGQHTVAEILFPPAANNRALRRS
jgi:hypothetical protein